MATATWLAPQCFWPCLALTLSLFVKARGQHAREEGVMGQRQLLHLVGQDVGLLGAGCFTAIV